MTPDSRERCGALWGALDKAGAALESIRRFQVRIEDQGESVKISEWANGLEVALNEFLRGLPREREND